MARRPIGARDNRIRLVITWSVVFVPASFTVLLRSTVGASAKTITIGMPRVPYSQNRLIHLPINVTRLVTSPPSRGAEYCDERAFVCLPVCVFVGLSAWRSG